MRIFFLSLFFGLLCVASVPAAVEIAREGEPATRIEEVYHHDGMAYVAIDDLLPALRFSGKWNSVDHVYRIDGAFGSALISPGSRFLRQGGQFEPVEQKPRFMDGRLRVSDEFIRKHLLPRATGRVFYRDLNPGSAIVAEESSAMDRLFSFLLRKKNPANTPQLRAIAIDPGHGGQDPGSIGLNGVKEKDVTLALALQLQKQVKMELGIPVYMTRDADYALGLEERWRTAAQPDVDVLLLLHAQSSFSLQTRGVFLYIRPAGPDAATAAPDESLRLAEMLATALKKTGFVVRGIVTAPLLPMGQGDLPTVLIEAGFLTNPDDRPILGAVDGQQRFTAALFEGLKNFSEKRQKAGTL